ncbi:hypothetical protein IMSAGC021_00406 [Muribaculaceae bacterium]|mgnify:FL=1|jgi:hypothetical protein|nr:hypothetical protein IMSAGC021_00406 [Muribaculaceae bacterium]
MKYCFTQSQINRPAKKREKNEKMRKNKRDSVHLLAEQIFNLRQQRDASIVNY